jgi:vancomycin resistance protein YoaR
MDTGRTTRHAGASGRLDTGGVETTPRRSRSTSDGRNAARSGRIDARDAAVSRKPESHAEKSGGLVTGIALPRLKRDKGTWKSKGDSRSAKPERTGMLFPDAWMHQRERGRAGDVGRALLGVLMLALSFILKGLKALGALAVAACRRSKAAFAVLVVAAVLVVGGVFDTATHVGKVMNHVHVGEINASGMTEEQLSSVLVQHYGTRLVSSGVTIYASEEAMNNHEQNPQDSGGLSVEQQAAQTVNWYADKASLQAYIDYSGIVAEAMKAGRGGPLDRIGLALSKRTIDVDVNYNEACIELLAQQIDLALGYSYVNSQVIVENGKATATQSSDGVMIDRGELKAKLTEQLIGSKTENREFFETAVETPAQISTEKGQAAADRANSAISQGVSFQYEGQSWTVDTATMGSWVSTNIVKDDAGECTLSVYIDPKKAQADIAQYAKPSFMGGTETVQFEKQGDEIVVKLGSEGTMPQVNRAVSALNDKVLGEGASNASTPDIVIESTSVPSEMTLNQALNAGVVSVISEYTTEYTSGATERNNNIHLAADLLNNSIVKANGGIWSFNETAGECNEEKGFQAAGSIVGDELIDEIGGGICQVATTVFNSVYEVGLPIVERHNHSMYISSYPSGRDAAVSWPDLDLKWENETSSDILLKTSYTDTSITATLYGVDPGYTVTTDTGAWEEGDKYETVYKYDEEYGDGYSYVKSYGSDGQSITVTRTVTDRTGNVVHEDTFVSVYQPTNEVIVRGGTADDWAEQDTTTT